MDVKRVVTLTEEQLPQLLALGADAMQEDAWSGTQIAQQLARPRSINIGVFVEAQLVGFVFATYLFDEAELLQIGTTGSMRGNGLGKALLSALAERLQAEEVTRLMLEVRSSNTAALALYQRVGFAQDGRRKGYYAAPNESGEREDAVLMSSPVSAVLTSLGN
ncbi:ribosomal protein S18-alanine N-acetyltransferase [Neptunomonas sp. XY-337]|uniref:ribosomal protein S18-alanine N-acetyltransferase n=1 Tax=Neptunomonas sp. XY-337 TaxID=2561897 RepID=UPI0010AAC83F|nr:ribosomal protein S18-alanine N-acetyltransferase [Neptunomonas sp. XY-337]